MVSFPSFQLIQVSGASFYCVSFCCCFCYCCCCLPSFTVLWLLPLRAREREAIHINEVHWKYKPWGLQRPQIEFPVIIFTGILIGYRWYPFRYSLWENTRTKHQISTLWSRSIVLFLLFHGLLLSTVAFVVAHLFCLEILCGDILLSNSNPQPFNAQSLRPSANSHENTNNTGSSSEK